VGGREAGAPSDLKMPLENGRADEKVSRGQASERAVCVCVAVSLEKGARRPPLPAPSCACPRLLSSRCHGRARDFEVMGGAAGA